MLGTEPQVDETYVKTGKVRVIFSPVLNHGDRSYVAHQAAECAGDQDQFWAFRHFLYENQDALWSGDIRATVKQLAATAGLESADFDACIDSERHYDRVDAQDAIRRAAGIRAQPFFDFNGDVYGGAPPFEAFVQVIEGKLAE